MQSKLLRKQTRILLMNPTLLSHGNVSVKRHDASNCTVSAFLSVQQYNHQGEYCKDCNCTDCHNLIQYDNERAQAIDEALMRDPNAFDGKAKQRKGGCICKKTGCIKKYCQCYNSGQVCTSECKCLNCQNSVLPNNNEAQIHYQVNLQSLINQMDN